MHDIKFPTTCIISEKRREYFKFSFDDINILSDVLDFFEISSKL